MSDERPALGEDSRLQRREAEPGGCWHARSGKREARVRSVEPVLSHCPGRQDRPDVG
jgi:hypothetical protein